MKNALFLMAIRQVQSVVIRTFTPWTLSLQPTSLRQLLNYIFGLHFLEFLYK